MSKIRAAIIFPGYVESNAVAGVPFFSTDGVCLSAEELLENLGWAIVTACQGEETPQKACCAANPDSKFCPECGAHNAPKESPTVEDLAEFTRHFLHGTCDSIGGQIWEDVGAAGWSFGPSALKAVLQEDAILFVYEMGAEVLARAHLEQLHEEDDDYGRWLTRHAEIVGRPGVAGTWKMFKD